MSDTAVVRAAAVLMVLLLVLGAYLGYRATIASYRSDQFCGANESASSVAARAHGWSVTRRWKWWWPPGYVTTCIYAMPNGSIVAVTPPGQ